MKSWEVKQSIRATRNIFIFCVVEMPTPKGATSKVPGKAKKKATGGDPLLGRAPAHPYTAATLRDALFNTKVFEEKDSNALRDRLIQELKETPAIEGICNFLNVLLPVMPAELALTPLATLQLALPFLESELRLSFSRFNHYAADRQDWIVGRAAQIEVCKRLITLMVTAGVQEGFSTTLHEALTACVEQQYASLCVPRNASRNAAKSGHGAGVVVEGAAAGMTGGSAPAVRATFDSSAPETPLTRDFAGVPGMRPLVTTPFDIAEAPEEFAGPLCGFVTNAAHNLVHSKKQVCLGTGLLQTASDRKWYKDAKGYRRGAYKYNASFFLQPPRNLREISYFPDGVERVSESLDASLEMVGSDEEVDDPAAEFLFEEDDTFAPVDDAGVWCSGPKPGCLAPDGRGYVSGYSRTGRGSTRRREYSSSFFAGVPADATTSVTETLADFFRSAMEGSATSGIPTDNFSQVLVDNLSSVLNFVTPLCQLAWEANAAAAKGVDGVIDAAISSPVAGCSSSVTPASGKSRTAQKTKGPKTSTARAVARGITRKATRFRGVTRNLSPPKRCASADVAGPTTRSSPDVSGGFVASSFAANPFVFGEEPILHGVAGEDYTGLAGGDGVTLPDIIATQLTSVTLISSGGARSGDATSSIEAATGVSKAAQSCGGGVPANLPIGDSNVCEAAVHGAMLVVPLDHTGGSQEVGINPVVSGNVTPPRTRTLTVTQAPGARSVIHAKASDLLDPILMSRLHISAACCKLVRAIFRVWGVSPTVIYDLLRRPAISRLSGSPGPLHYQALGTATTIQGCFNAAYVESADPAVVTAIYDLYQLLFVTYPKSTPDSGLVHETLTISRPVMEDVSVPILREAVGPSTSGASAIHAALAMPECQRTTGHTDGDSNSFIDDTASTGEWSTSEDSEFVGSQAALTDETWVPSGGGGGYAKSVSLDGSAPVLRDGLGVTRVLKIARRRTAVTYFQAGSPPVFIGAPVIDGWDTDSTDARSCLATRKVTALADPAALSSVTGTENVTRPAINPGAQSESAGAEGGASATTSQSLMDPIVNVADCRKLILCLTS